MSRWDEATIYVVAFLFCCTVVVAIGTWIAKLAGAFDDE